MSISACLASADETFQYTKDAIEILKPYVDEIHIQGCLNQENIEFLTNKKVTYHEEKMTNDISAFLNKMLTKIKTRWVVVFLNNEVPTQAMAASIPLNVEYSNNGKYYESCRYMTSDIVNDIVLPPKLNRIYLHLNMRSLYLGQSDPQVRDGMFARTKNTPCIVLRWQ